MSYSNFLDGKSQLGGDHGFDPLELPSHLFPFQSDLVAWSLRKGRAAIFADCGMGKTPMQLAWSDNVARHTDGRVLIATPLAVSHQTVNEGEKFGIEATRSSDGQAHRITVTNYERLPRFDPSDFSGMVCDESSILKNFDGVRRAQVTEFMRRMKYRLLCTATAAPNDYTELGTSSEALGELGHMDMLSRFFKNEQNTSMAKGGGGAARWSGHAPPKWRFRGHSEQPFWRWVCSWARALRRPSDLGYDDSGFVLPELIENEHVVECETLPSGLMFPEIAVGLKEQREERRRTIQERCERVAELADHDRQVLVWCHLNAESEILRDLVPGAEEVAGGHSDEIKESRLRAFADGNLRALVTKPKIGAWGLNLQRCSHVTFFPSHSYEQYYQGVRRCWRFGQDKPVTVDIVTSEGESGVLKNLRRKAGQADEMFSSLVAEMTDTLKIHRTKYEAVETEVPGWL